MTESRTRELQRQDRAAAVSCRVETLPPHREQWNEALRLLDGAQVYHRAEWDDAFAVYRLPIVRLVAYRSKEPVGLLPLVVQRSWLFGSRLVSLPWFDTAGLLAADNAARDALLAEARTLAVRSGVNNILLRQPSAFDGRTPLETNKVLLRLPLEPDPDQLWRRLRDKVRNQVRKARKNDLVVEQGGDELIADFYRVYATNMRDLGSPPHSRRFFTAVLRALAGQARVYVVRLQRRAIGAGLTLANGDRLETPWASSLRRYGTYCVNHLMYWTILEDACRAGYRWFHFGRSSRGTGPYLFKKQWGAEDAPLYWYSLPLDETDADASPPAADDGPANTESYGWAVRLWRRLPVRLARMIGPRLIRKLP